MNQVMNSPLSVSKPRATAAVLLIADITIAGTDLSPDLQLIEALGLQVYTVDTAHPAAAIAAKFTQLQQALHTDDALPLAAIKLGRLDDEAAMLAVHAGILALQASGQQPRIIIDPVLVNDAGERLLTPQAEQVFITTLLPLAAIVTPGLQALTLLTGLSINSDNTTRQTVKQLVALGVTAVLLKDAYHTVNPSSNESNGAASHPCSDYFFSEHLQFWLNSHYSSEPAMIPGSGSLFATAIACASAQGYSVADAIVLAKARLNRSLRQATSVNGTDQLCATDTDPDHWGVVYQDFPTLTPYAPTVSAPALPRCDTQTLGIYPVVDSVAWVEKLINCGIQTIQLRLKTDVEHPPTPTELDQQIQAAVAVCAGRNIRLFINDHWQLAIKHRAYGIHLGQEDLYDADLQAIADAGCRLGVSTHSYTEVARALWIKPSYIALGPIYATTSKQMPWVPQGVAAVERWTALLSDHYPLVAIGGINAARAAALKPTGIGSVAMISAITQAADYQQATRELMALWRR